MIQDEKASSEYSVDSKSPNFIRAHNVGLLRDTQVCRTKKKEKKWNP